MSALDILPAWRCHKVVRAAQIKSIDRVTATLQLTWYSDDGYATNIMGHAVGAAWVDKHAPEAGGYFVVYEDGYTSYSPADAFLGGYDRVE